MLSLTSIQKILGLRGEVLRNYFDDLSLEIVIPKLIQYVHQLAHSQNVVWLSKNEFERIQRAKETNEVLEPEQLLYRKIDIQSFIFTEEKQIEAYVANFSESTTGPQVQMFMGITNILFPVVYKNNNPIAYILLIDVKPHKSHNVLKRLSKDLSYMSKHISFSIQYWDSKKQNYVDDLTGLYNQKYLQMVLENEIHRAQRENLKFSVLFMDVDYFKAVNDTRGHWVGSRLLIEIGRVLSRNIRKSDYAFRYGGDEFVVVLPFSAGERAVKAAERLRGIIEKTHFVIDGERMQLTLSIGLATYPTHAQTYKDIIKMADEAMYCGKNKSRNIVFVAS